MGDIYIYISPKKLQFAAYGQFVLVFRLFIYMYISKRCNLQLMGSVSLFSLDAILKNCPMVPAWRNKFGFVIDL